MGCEGVQPRGQPCGSDARSDGGRGLAVGQKGFSRLGSCPAHEEPTLPLIRRTGVGGRRAEPCCDRICYRARQLTLPSFRDGARASATGPRFDLSD